MSLLADPIRLRARSGAELISVVVPVYNEMAVLPDFHARLAAVLATLPVEAEVLYVNDGSRDATASVLRSLRVGDARVAVLELSRNFGKEAALTAGLDHARGEAVVVIDADLQDPPECIPEMLHAWREGFDMVTMRRASRPAESWLKRVSAAAYYRLLNRLSAVPIPVDTGDFRLLSRRALLALRELPERNRYMKGLFAWIGFRQKEIIYDRDARAAGKSRWPYTKLIRLAFDGITSFTSAPLRLATVAGLITACAALAFGVWTIIKTLVFGEPVAGYPSLMTVMLFLGGIQLLAIGIQGEYLGRLYEESKQRPVYLKKAYQPAAATHTISKQTAGETV